MKALKKLLAEVWLTVDYKWLLGLVVLSVVGGSGVMTAIRLALVVAVCGIPGVFLLRAATWGPANSSEGWLKGLGYPLGLILAALSQQVFLSTHVLGFGWIVPAVATLPFLARTHSKSDREMNRKPVISNDFSLIVAASCLLLADHNWVFLFSGVCVGVYSLWPRLHTRILAISGLAFVWVTIPTYWYLVSDDRLFEEAYSRSIHKFGFWDWYGSSETWVPYHWFGHAIAGLFQSTVSSKSYVAVGLLTIIFAVIAVAVTLVHLVRAVIRSESGSKAAVLLIPLLGVFFLGESNSADMSIALGIWTLAIVHLLELVRRDSWSRLFVISVALISVEMTKVSTGLVVITGLLVYSLICWTGTRRSFGDLLWMLAPFVASAVAFVLNFNVLGATESTDGRTKFSFAVGEALFSSQPLASRVAAVAISLAFILVLPTVLAMGIRSADRTLFALAAAALTMLLIGFGLRSLTIAYNNESYFDAALLCSIPILAALTVRISNGLIAERYLCLVALTGLIVGTCVEVVSRWSGAPILVDVARITVGPVVMLVVLVGLFTVSRMKPVTGSQSGRMMYVGVLAVYGLAFYGGADADRVIAQIDKGTVWAETGFGESDQFFFGTADDVAASGFLATNSQPEELIGTNRLCAVGEGCVLDGQTAIAAWSRMRTYVEGERFTTGRKANGVGADGAVDAHPRWLTERKELMISFGQDQSDGRIQLLQEQEIEWYWLDLTRNSGQVTNPELVAFQSPTVVILDLRAREK